ncbi:hypothetical protein EZS27_023703, partial [termite gut metagenome]
MKIIKNLVKFFTELFSPYVCEIKR